MFQYDWQHNNIASGDFTVPSDRAIVCQLGETAAAGKLKHLQIGGPVDAYRYFAAHKHKLLGLQPLCSDVDDFLTLFQFGSLEAAASNHTGMTGLLCAVYAGHVQLLRLLVESRADVNQRVRGLGEFGFYDSMTPLIIATRSNQGPDILHGLIELGADAACWFSVGD